MPTVEWHAARTKDPLTDVESCRVQFGYLSSDRQFMFGQVGRLYPYAQVSGGVVSVGVRSLVTGTFSIPVGDIEMRIDDQPMVAIAAAETPVAMSSSTAAMMSGARDQVVAAMKANGAAEDRVAEYQAAMAQTGSAISSMFAPYTAAVGEKAAGLIASMKAGRMLIYRQNSGAVRGGPGTASLAGFTSAAAECGL